MKLASLPFAILAVAAPLSAQDAAVPAEPCNVAEYAQAQPAWRLVRGEGFTFCLPADWSPQGKRSSKGVDARKWWVKGGTIEWRTGSVRDDRRVPFTVTRAPGRVPVASRGAPPNVPPLGTAPSSIQRYSESIDGRTATLWLAQPNPDWRTGASWGSPAIVFTGDATTRELAALELDIFRTVRFARD